MAEFEIPESARVPGGAQLRLDGEEEPVHDPTPPSLRHVFREPPLEGEAGVLADCQALVKYGGARWVRRRAR